MLRTVGDVPGSDLKGGKGRGKKRDGEYGFWGTRWLRSEAGNLLS